MPENEFDPIDQFGRTLQSRDDHRRTAVGLVNAVPRYACVRRAVKVMPVATADMVRGR